MFVVKNGVVSKTVIIGDSMFAGGSSIPDLLTDWSGHSLDNYARVGASLHEGWVLSIPKQYQMIPFRSNISTLIMDGGGNDVFSVQNDCRPMNQKCQKVIQESIQTVQDIFQKTRRDGVDQIIYLGFHYTKQLNQAIDKGMEELGKICKQEDHCFLVDPRPLDLPLGWDGIHPTSEGFQKLALAIWDMALAHNIEI